jgi:hypothetical protein
MSPAPACPSAAARRPRSPRRSAPRRCMNRRGQRGQREPVGTPRLGAQVGVGRATRRPRPAGRPRRCRGECAHCSRRRWSPLSHSHWAGGRCCRGEWPIPRGTLSRRPDDPRPLQSVAAECWLRSEAAQHSPLSVRPLFLGSPKSDTSGPCSRTATGAAWAWAWERSSAACGRPVRDCARGRSACATCGKRGSDA